MRIPASFIIRIGEAVCMLAFWQAQSYQRGMKLSRETLGYGLGLIGVIIFGGTWAEKFENIREEKSK